MVNSRQCRHGVSIALACFAVTLLAASAGAERAMADVNLATGGRATASSSQSTNHSPGGAIDGDLGTRWGSAYTNGVPSTDSWQVDLGTIRTVGQVAVNWEVAYAVDYDVQVSTTGTNWTTVAEARGLTSAARRTHNFSAVDARYVKLVMTRKGTIYGYSFWEVDVSAPSTTTGEPDTSITSGPSGITTARQPAFAFSSNEAGSTFECALDSEPYGVCSTPFTTPVLKHGDHTLSVRARDASGRYDESPASRAFTVVGPEAGKSRLTRSAPTGSNHWTRPASGSCSSFYSRYARVTLFAPFSDQCVTSGYTGGLAYHDVQAIYKDGAGNPRQPSWVLRDGSGNDLYIPFACEGGTCPTYAADIGNPAYRAWYIDQVRTSLSKGYRGVMVDDANWNLNVSNGAGDYVTPIDPRTGEPMTLANWKRYLAELLEELSAAIPGKELMINSVWWKSEHSLSDPMVVRGVKAATHYQMERGTRDVFAGQSWTALLAYIDKLQTYGVDVDLHNYFATTRPQAEFEMASYFLISTGLDSYNAAYRSCPDANWPSPCSEPWWPAYSVDLGLPTGGRTILSGGAYRRLFANGMVLVNPPGGSAQTIPLGATYTTLDGEAVTSVDLPGGSAAVLRR